MKIFRASRCALLLIALLFLVILGRGLVERVTTEAANGCGHSQEVAPPVGLRPYVKLACFNRNGAAEGGGVRLHLTHRGAALASRPGNAVAARAAEFVVGDSAWLGDRPMASVAAEIRWHARLGKFQPIQIQYRCRDLDWYEPFWRC